MKRKIDARPQFSNGHIPEPVFRAPLSGSDKLNLNIINNLFMITL